MVERSLYDVSVQLVAAVRLPEIVNFHGGRFDSAKVIFLFRFRRITVLFS